jgi:serine/threonine protein kinase
MIVMQYANDGDLLSYLNQNINKLTWKMKLQLLKDIASTLRTMQWNGLVHCDIHGGNIVLRKRYPKKTLSRKRKEASSHSANMNEEFALSRSFICDLGLSRSTKSAAASNSNIRGVPPFIAPEVFSNYKFTQKSDIYAFGIIMYLVATGESPFRDISSDKDLVCDVLSGRRPTMPSSAPNEYRRLAMKCCAANPMKRPEIYKICRKIEMLIRKAKEDESDNNVWNTIYHNDVEPLSRPEKENEYPCKLLPNINELGSVAGMKSLHWIVYWCIITSTYSQHY